MSAAALRSLRLSDMILTHMQLGDVKVRLDRAQFPRLIFQKHPQLFQSGPKGLRRKKRERGWSKEKKDKKKKSEKVKPKRSTSVHY